MGRRVCLRGPRKFPRSGSAMSNILPRAHGMAEIRPFTGSHAVGIWTHTGPTCTTLIMAGARRKGLPAIKHPRLHIFPLARVETERVVLRLTRSPRDDIAFGS